MSLWPGWLSLQLKFKVCQIFLVFLTQPNPFAPQKDLIQTKLSYVFKSFREPKEGQFRNIYLICKAMYQKWPSLFQEHKNLSEVRSLGQLQVQCFLNTSWPLNIFVSATKWLILVRTNLIDSDSFLLRCNDILFCTLASKRKHFTTRLICILL